MALPFEYTAYIWLLLASAVFLTAMGIYALRDLSVPGSVPFIILLAGLMLWVLANALGLASADDQTRIFWFKFKAAGIKFLSPLLLIDAAFTLDAPFYFTTLQNRNESKRSFWINSGPWRC
jgi:hypothetical protein